MRTGAAAAHDGYFHEALCYGDDDEFLAVAVPFLRDGSDAGEPTLVALGEHTGELVRSALPPSARIDFALSGERYVRPAVAIRSYRDLLSAYVAAGAGQIRILGELPPSAFGLPWDAWARYESVVNHALDDFPVWTMCAYDRRVTPDPVLSDVLRTHPIEARPDGGHARNLAYTPPEEFDVGRRPAEPDPLELTPPVADLIDPTPGEARRATRAAGPGSLGEAEVSDLVVAVSEAVTNAILHGRPPIRVRVWQGGDRLVVTVSDAGPGPADPFAGLRPADWSSLDGRGLWILQQSCSLVVTRRDADGFTLRMTAGDPH